MQQSLLVLPFTFAILTLVNSEVSAQGLVYTLGNDGDMDMSRLGIASDNAEDFDGDGVDDIIVGDSLYGPVANRTGAVFVYSGMTGQLLASRLGEHDFDQFGSSVAGIGDLDGDGKSEVIVGAPFWDNNGAWASASGKIYILKGPDLSVMQTQAVNEQDARMGTSVCGLGDITGDGVGDYAYSLPYRDWNGMVDSGYAAFYSGAGLSLLFAQAGEVPGAHYGESMDAVRATGSPAASRILIGEGGVNGPGTDYGQARLIDGLGTTLLIFSGQQNNGWFGYDVAGIGDIDGDGWEDVAIGAPFVDSPTNGVNAGVVQVFSGATGSALFEFEGAGPSSRFGMSVSGLDDFNGDGFDDILCGAQYDEQAGLEAGEVRVCSGIDGSTLNSWFGAPGDFLGSSTCSVGDINSDGFPDFAVGAPLANNDSGLAYVFLGGNSPATVYCIAMVNSHSCTPAISIEGLASMTIADNCIVRASNVNNQKPGMLFWGSGANNAPFLGGTLCVQGPIQRTPPQDSGGSVFTSDCSGSYEFHFSQAYMASEGLVPGRRVYAQFWSRDPGSLFGVGLTDAVAFDVLP